jgi:hypothetical protein
MIGKEREYVCELCKGTFVSGWSEAEAKAEYQENFGAGGDEPPSVVCDDCYRRIIEEFPPPLSGKNKADSDETAGLAKQQEQQE